MHILRILPWAAIAGLVTFAAATWSTLPEQVPMHLSLSGEVTRSTDRTLLSWFGLSLVAIATQALLTWLGGLMLTRPDLLNHPERERLDRLPLQYRGPVISEVRAMLDVTGLSVALIFGYVQWMLYRAALGQPQGAGVVVIIVFSVVLTPLIFVFVSRTTTAIEIAEKKWRADDPSASLTAP